MKFLNLFIPNIHLINTTFSKLYMTSLANSVKKYVHSLTNNELHCIISIESDIFLLKNRRSQTFNVGFILQMWIFAVRPQQLQLYRAWLNLQKAVILSFIPTFRQTPWLCPTSLKHQPSGPDQVRCSVASPVPGLHCFTQPFTSEVDVSLS